MGAGSADSNIAALRLQDGEVCAGGDGQDGQRPFNGFVGREYDNPLQGFAKD